ncbi:MAG: aldose epimerase family protein [bacterium]
MVGVTTFGTTAAGQEVRKITLSRGDLSASILTRGATLQSVRLAGVAHDLTLGSDNLADYEGRLRYHGALVAPVVNRFTDARAPIGGKTFQFEPNQSGKHTLHFGAMGTHSKVWEIAEMSDSAVTLTVTLPAGEGNMPGNRPVRASFAITERGLQLDVTATTNALTLFNVANHSYWNMDGTETWAGHSLQIAADRYLPVTEDFCPNGEIAAVDGTIFDLRQMREIVPQVDSYDHNFCLSDGRVGLRDVLWLKGGSGVTMTIATTEAGVQVYDGRNGPRPGRGLYEGLAIEPQGWPDAPNHAGFPSIELRPGEAYHHTTLWQFSR